MSSSNQTKVPPILNDISTFHEQKHYFLFMFCGYGFFLKSIFCISHIESNTCCTNEGQCIHWIWACNLLTAQCRNFWNLLEYCFHENFVKATFFTKEVTKKFISQKMRVNFLLFPHCVEETINAFVKEKRRTNYYDTNTFCILHHHH